MVPALRYDTTCNCASLSLSLIALGTAVYSIFRPSHEIIVRMAWYQTFFLLEVVNAAIGKTKQKLLPSALQIGSRLFVIWRVCVIGKTYSYVFGAMAISWYLADTIRFNYYLHKESFFLRALRYNAFILLYPFGVCCELYLIYVTCIRDIVQETGRWPFSFYSLAILSYVPGFPYLYYHMWVLRSRALSRRVPAEPKKEQESRKGK